MVFEMSTGRAARTIPRIAMMDNSTNGKYLMSPLQKEIRAMLVAITDGRVAFLKA